MLNTLSKLYNLLHHYFHPSFEESAREAGILEDMRCSPEGLEKLEKIIKDLENERC